MPEQSPAANLWILYALVTVAFWGLYGVLLHTGQMSMADSENGRYKAFLWVGVAYFLAAVLAPAGLLLAKGASWSMPTSGVLWSLVAGIAGAIGAFGVLLAFGAKGHPAAVMSIVFAGAPIVNAFVSMSLHPPAGGLTAIRWQFVLGIVLAACGGLLVTFYKPAPGKPAARAAAPAAGSESGTGH
jgi:drug/metabolite transporter (DMT)-like permease